MIPEDPPLAMIEIWMGDCRYGDRIAVDVSNFYQWALGEFSRIREILREQEVQ